MRKNYKAFVPVFAVMAVFFLLNHETYCEQEMQLIGGGGQSRLYKCGSDVVKLYRMGKIHTIRT